MPPQEPPPTTPKDATLETWQIRPCFMYKEEYSDCTSIKARFNQYFIHGESVDCNQWKRDFDNCVKFEEKFDRNAAEAVIQSEVERRRVRMQAHYGNDVWKKRDGPPSDWSKPLPEWLQKEYENSYLELKSKEMRGEGEATPEIKSLCSIM